MTERTIVHLLRHGEVHNPDEVLYGRLPDFHLSDAGRAMAEAAARAVTGRDIVRVVGLAAGAGAGDGRARSRPCSASRSRPTRG